MSVTPAMRAFLDALQALLDSKEWPRLDRDGVTIAHGRDAIRVELPHASDLASSVELEVDDRTVVVSYGVEHQHFTDTAEALRFVEMLGDGRIRLVVKRSLVWNSIRSYRDGTVAQSAPTNRDIRIRLQLSVATPRHEPRGRS
jgi:hypothetical protein